MKFLVPNYSCLQNPWLRGYRPQIPFLSVLCPRLNLLKPPPPKKKIPGYATAAKYNSCIALCVFQHLRCPVLRFGRRNMTQCSVSLLIPQSQAIKWHLYCDTQLRADSSRTSYPDVCVFSITGNVQYSKVFTVQAVAEVELRSFLTPALHTGEWSASRLGLFTPSYRLNYVGRDSSANTVTR